MNSSIYFMNLYDNFSLHFFYVGSAQEGKKNILGDAN